MTTTSASDPNLAAAESTVVRFWNTVDGLTADPGKKLSGLTTVARGDVLGEWYAIINDFRRKGYRTTGHTQLGEPNAKFDRAGVATVTVCVDVSQVNLIDRAGKSVVSAKRRPRVLDDYAVAQDPKTEAWYVTQQELKGTC